MLHIRAWLSLSPCVLCSVTMVMMMDCGPMLQQFVPSIGIPHNLVLIASHSLVRRFENSLDVFDSKLHYYNLQQSVLLRN